MVKINYSKWSPIMLSILRIVAALLFMQHGSQKLFGIPPSQQGGTVAMFSQLWVAGVLEFFGGLLILLRLFTRPVAFILAGQMAVAYFTAHAPRAFWPIQNGGELAVLYCFLFLYLSAAGPGPLSLDSKLRRV